MAILDRKNPEAAIPQLEKRIDDLANSFVDRAFPVGCCFFTADQSYNPEKIGGEWERETNTSPYRWRRKR